MRETAAHAEGVLRVGQTLTVHTGPEEVVLVMVITMTLFDIAMLERREPARQMRRK